MKHVKWSSDTLDNIQTKLLQLSESVEVISLYQLYQLLFITLVIAYY